MKIKVNIIIIKLKDSCYSGILSVFYFLWLLLTPSYLLSNSFFEKNFNSTPDTTSVYFYKSDSSFIESRLQIQLLENDSLYIIENTQISGQEDFSSNTIQVNQTKVQLVKQPVLSKKHRPLSISMPKKHFSDKNDKLLLKGSDKATWVSTLSSNSGVIFSSNHFRFLCLLSMFILRLISCFVQKIRGFSISSFFVTKKLREQCSRPPPLY